MAASNKLKALRNKCQVTVREVEQASRRIAEAKGDKNYCISNSWLAQLENGISAPNIWTIFSLCAIYRVTIREFLQLYNLDTDEINKYTFIANPHLTLLNPNSNGNEQLAPPANDDRRHIVTGYIGQADYTMHPMIRPGAIVEIDTTQNKLHSNSWHNEFERPIFFIELRDGYACGWCEVQGHQLLLLPHHSSPATVRRFFYPRDAEIVGRVVSYNTPCIDPAPEVQMQLRGITSKSLSTLNAPSRKSQ